MIRACEQDVLHGRIAGIEILKASTRIDLKTIFTYSLEVDLIGKATFPSRKHQVSIHFCSRK